MNFAQSYLTKRQTAKTLRLLLRTFEPVKNFAFLINLALVAVNKNAYESS